LRDGFPFLGGDRRFVCHVMFDIVLQIFGAQVSKRQVCGPTTMPNLLTMSLRSTLTGNLSL
jgi:hypothetical protein